MKTKEAKTKKKKKTTEDVAIPTAGDSKPSKKLSLAARFARKSKPTTQVVAKKDRAKMAIPEELAQRYAEYAPTKALFDLLSARNDREKQDLNVDLWDCWVELLWKKKTQPQNPKIVVNGPDGKPDCEGMFQITTGTKIKIDMPPVGEEEEPDEVFVQALVDLGVEQDDALALVEREIDFTPIWNVNLTTLMHGSFGSDFTPATDDDKSGAEPLFLALMGVDEDGEPMSASARNEMLTEIPEEGWAALGSHLSANTQYGVQLVDPSSFLDRVCNYAHSIDQLKSILTMIKPLSFMTRTKAFVNDDPATKARRLTEEAAARVGADLGVEPETKED